MPSAVHALSVTVETDRFVDAGSYACHMCSTRAGCAPIVTHLTNAGLQNRPQLLNGRQMIGEIVGFLREADVVEQR